MAKRPYISKQLPELESIVAGTSDASVLDDIRLELAYRTKKKRVHDLREKIAEKLSENEAKETKVHDDLFSQVDTREAWVGDSAPQKIKPKPTKARVKVKPRVRVAEGSAPKSKSSVTGRPLDEKSTVNKTIKLTPDDILKSMIDSCDTANKTEVSYPAGFLTKTFEDMRKKLLDISGGRSRLLNLNQDTKGFVRVVDELPNQLAEELLAGKTFTMDAVDDPKQAELIEHGYLERDEEDENWVAVKSMPTAREWARIKGINIDYELPLNSGHADDDRHQDNDVQTVLFESALTTNLKKLTKEAKTSIEETGNNILFLSLGFLEWADKIGGKNRLAPLYMIPVSIDKFVSKKGITRYQIKFTGEDIISNLTLREKLSQDFEVELPDIMASDDEDKLYTPEEYFNEVETLLAFKKGDASMAGWKVRRFGTLATLSLGRLLMYRDLDPARWPQGDANLVNHEFIRKFFSDVKTTASSGTGGGSSEGYVLDDVPDLHEKFPMVEDADSSQMSALIDILKGQNMVVEGPPGTGKSQTITNLIAAAISQGKSVLFVAEKQAALDVVKRRMDKAGLGHFCLDLHSDKAQKRMVLDSFNERIQFENQHDYSADDYDVQVQRFERSREQLQSYCLMVNQPWKETGFSIHEILCAATRYAKDVAPLEYHTIAPDGVTGDSFTRINLDEQLEQLELFFKYLEIVGQQLPEAGNWQSHPWYGVNNKQISGADERLLLAQLQDWTGHLNSVTAHLLSVFVKHSIAHNQDLSLPALENWVAQLNLIKPLYGDEYLPAFKRIEPKQIESLENYVQLAQGVAKGFKELASIFNQGLLADLTQLGAIKDSISNLGCLGVKQNVQFDDLARSVARIESTIKLVQSVEHKRGELLPHLPMVYKADLEALFAISQSGLTELACFIEHAMNLPSELLSYRDDIYDEESLPLIFTEFKKEQEKLLADKKALQEVFKLDRLPEIKEIQEFAGVMENTGLFSFLSGNWRKTKHAILSFSVKDKIDKKTITKALEDLASWKDASAVLKDSTKYQKAFGRDFNGLDTDSQRIETLMTWYQAVRKDYGIGFGTRTVMASALFNINKDIFRGIQQLHSGGVNTKISEVLSNLNDLSALYTEKESITDPVFNLAPSAEPLQQTLLDIRISLEGIQKYLINPNLDQKELLLALGKLENISQHKAQVEQANLSEVLFDGQLDLTLNSKGSLPSGLAVVESTLTYMTHLYAVISEPELLDLLTKRISFETVDDLLVDAKGLASELDASSNLEQLVYQAIESDRDHWTKGCGEEAFAICERNQLAMDSIEWLDGWTKYLHAKDRMQQGGYGRLKDYLSDSEFTLEYGKQVMNFAVYTCLANEVYQQQPELSQRSGHEQTAVQQQFKKYDEGLKSLQRKRVAHLALGREIDPGTSGAKVSSYSGGKLLHHEIGKKSKHIAIRKLVERAGDAMLGYKPCFMMSPMAVAKYLPPGEVEFDLVVMDEASQVKPEYALSCFARGKQAVVVGDPKQLPPTSFFDRSTSNDEAEDNDEKGVINESESILEAIGAHYPKRMLKWHYRSRHESLIAFSNRYFYDNELVVFPSPWEQSDEFGIKFTHVTNGVFVNNVNNEEAKYIVEAVKHHFAHSPNESLGIVAMNTKQRDQIEAALESARATDDILAAGFTHDAQTEEPIFIKNLENVQGDERDVIMISFTYGPQNKGSNSVPQRFFPINTSQGWRRLNVLFTRAKKRIQVYSSMRSGHIIVNENKSRGVKALKNYLAYAESGELIDQAGESQGAPDSDFEIAVMKQLEKAGFECVPQVGVAKFKIDVGVRDPGMPGSFLMGIECDGATYHSDKSTRDRDRVRQGVLEGLGWNIQRIWSTDWFKNPDAELKPIIDQLRELATPVREVVSIEEAHSSEVPVIHDEEVLDELIIEEKVSLKSLNDRLVDFNKNIIEKYFPNTPVEERLLRSEMIHFLALERPTDHDEFAEYIPAYLRTHSSSEEAAEFLGDVLEIIAVYEEMTSSSKDNGEEYVQS
ncbi:MAG: DUF4011 domain-containing anti-phage protein Hhe [Cycloclasticus sp.]